MCDMCPAILQGSTCRNDKRFFIIYTLLKSPIHLSFVHMYYFSTLSLAVWQDTCHTYMYKNLVNDLAHHESSHSSVVRASNRYLEGHGFDSRWGLRKIFFWVFWLENTSSLFTLYPSHQAIYYACDPVPIVLSRMLFSDWLSCSLSIPW